MFTQLLHRYCALSSNAKKKIPHCRNISKIL